MVVASLLTNSKQIKGSLDASKSRQANQASLLMWRKQWEQCIFDRGGHGILMRRKRREQFGVLLVGVVKHGLVVVVL